MANLVPSYTVTQNISNPTVLHFVDTSTGYNPYVDERRIYLKIYNGTYLVPTGTTTDYIVWDINEPTIDVDVMDKDYAIQIDVQWIATQPVPEQFNIYATGIEQIENDAFEITSTGDYTIDWGDGDIETFAAGTHNHNHTYATPYTGAITIAAPNLSVITSLVLTGGEGDILPAGTPLKIYTSELVLLDSLTTLNLSSYVLVSGIASQLPSTLTILILNNTSITGTVTQLPTGLVQLLLRGATTISGTIPQLPGNLTYLILGDNTVITGDIGDVPAGLGILYLTGTGNVTGNVNDLPSGMTEIVITCPNTVTGDVVYIPASATTVIIKGSNTIDGSLSDLSSSLINFTLEGNNTVYGTLSNISAFSSLQIFNVDGNNTISGDFNDVPANIKTCIILGNNTVSDYTYPHTWASTMANVILSPVSGGLDDTQVDNLLIDLANVTTWVGEKQVTLQGTNAARTSASDAAVATLQGKGVTVTTN